MYSFNTISKILSTNNTKLIFNKKIEEKSAQGSCGLLILDENNPVIKSSSEYPQDCRDLISDFKTNTVFYKYGNNGKNCTLSRQEYIISQSLMSTCAHLPNFLRSILYMKNHFIRKDKCIDPFDISNANDKNMISCTDLVIFEYIDTKISFYNFLKTKNISEDLINSVIMQVFLCIICAQQNVNFVHNDLHANNILIIKCDKNLKILYRLKILNKEYTFLIPTYGYIPIIIDYGFSYTKECENMSIECLDLDNYGLITYQYDSLSDFIRFCVVLSGRKVNEKLSLKIKELFRNLPISMENSWEKIVDKDTLWYIEKIFKKGFDVKYYKKNSQYLDQILRLILRKILLPISYNNKYNEVVTLKELETFIQEYNSIEKWLTYTYEKVFIFREFIDCVRKYNTDYKKISFEISSNLKFILKKDIPLDVNWELLINSLNNFCGSIENLIYKKIKDLNLKRQKILYAKIKSGEYIFNELLPTIYKDEKKKLCKDDLILLIDNTNKSNMIIKIKKLEYLNPEKIYKKFFQD